ncbi:unnamed protein product [Musa hybrid cultivar]
MVLGIFVTVPSGYHGNPYVALGCQDIDEWSDKDQNPCHGICQNLPGSCDAFNGPCTQHQKLQSSAKVAIGKSLFSTMTFIFVEDLITHLMPKEDMISFRVFEDNQVVAIKKPKIFDESQKNEFGKAGGSEVCLERDLVPADPRQQQCISLFLGHPPEDCSSLLAFINFVSHHSWRREVFQHT